MARVTRVGRVPVDSTSEAEGKATLTGSLVNVYELWMAEEWLGIWGIAGFGTGASDLTTVGGGIPEESLLSWLDALLSGLVELGARLDGGDAQRGLGAEAGAELRFTHTGIGLGLAGRVRMLLVHEDPEVREWGASATLTWEPPDRGPWSTEMRNAMNFPAGAAHVTAFALLAAALLLAGCDVPGLEDAVEEPGAEFRDCAECPAMVAVPAGSYTMGSPAAEAGRHADEGQRRVTIEEPFAVGVYEVTFAEWDACAVRVRRADCAPRPG